MHRASDVMAGGAVLEGVRKTHGVRIIPVVNDLKNTISFTVEHAQVVDSTRHDMDVSLEDGEALDAFRYIDERITQDVARRSEDIFGRELCQQVVSQLFCPTVNDRIVKLQVDETIAPSEPDGIPFPYDARIDVRVEFVCIRDEDDTFSVIYKATHTQPIQARESADV